jgi:hypothetical protein
MGNFKITPEIDNASIVLIGNFNPMIFQPYWFMAQEIFSPDEANNAKIEVIHPEITIFSIEWLSIRVEKNVFTAISLKQPHIHVHDFIVNTFGNCLIHTPIYRLGINRTVEFKTDISNKDKLGKTLAPQSAWGDWGKEIEGPKTGEKHGGLREIVMEQRNLDDRYRGHIQAKVGSSINLNDGILVNINDHYETEENDKVIGCEKIITLIKDNFEDSIRRSGKIINHIMSLAV